jgi:hypothetical protein
VLSGLSVRRVARTKDRGGIGNGRWSAAALKEVRRAVAHKVNDLRHSRSVTRRGTVVAPERRRGVHQGDLPLDVVDGDAGRVDEVGWSRRRALSLPVRFLHQETLSRLERDVRHFGTRRRGGVEGAAVVALAYCNDHPPMLMAVVPGLNSSM